jgi:lysophospholipase L1-like esterase
MMRYLIIGDSHVWDLHKYMLQLDSTANSMIICRGRSSHAVSSMYREQLFDAYLFDPQYVIIHLGHNDMAEHKFLNPMPRHPLAITDQLINFAREVDINFPSAKLLLSSTLPRHYTDSANLTLAKTLTYNSSCKRLGQGLRHDAVPFNLQVGLNMPFWAKISKALENSSLYASDGLHLNPDGKLQLIISWLLDLMVIVEYKVE